MQINKAQIRFLVILIVGYFLLDYFFKFWIGLCAEGGFYWDFAAKNLNFIETYRHFLLWGSGKISDVFGIRHLRNDTGFLLVGHGSVKIVYSCLGFGIISMLSALAFAVPHQKLKNRLIFLLSAFLFFSLLNMVRLFILSYYARQASKMNIDHHALFNWFCYLLIFIAMYYWIKRSSNLQTVSKR